MMACLGTLTTWTVAGAFLKKVYLSYFRTVNIWMAVVLIYFSLQNYRLNMLITHDFIMYIVGV